MKRTARMIQRLTGNQRGAVAALVGILLVTLIGIVAYAIDMNHLYMVRNELQNAADAGALAGASALYADPDGAGPELPGSKVNTDANQEAYDVATANMSDRYEVDINWTSGNNGDVQRGHWSFATRTFTPNPSEAPTDLWLKSDAELDADPNFINAVRVIVHRQDPPAESFFGRFLGRDSFVMHADAVAYLGFSGSLGPGEAEQPIVICEGTLTNEDDQYQCNVGRMLDSGASCPPSDPSCETTLNTAGWSTMDVLGTAGDPDFQCTATASASVVKSLVCQDDGANESEIRNSDLLQATNGVQAASYNDMRSCWSAVTNGGREPYQMNLPVVECGSGNQVDNCVKVVGAVTVNMLYMSPGGGTKPADAPVEMIDPDPAHDDFQDWDSGTDCADFDALVGLQQKVALPQLPGQEPVTDKWLVAERWDGASSTKLYTDGMARWDCFVEHFEMINTNNKWAPIDDKVMYFMPDCSPHEPTGRSGGSNFGVLAKIPVLVE